jgi:glycosyltransferase involved in cell wall biosynthesis
MYAKAIKNGETGYIANTPEEFVHLIDVLSHDADLRQTIGNAARVDIEDNYDIGKRTKQFVDILTNTKPLVVGATPQVQSLKTCWIPTVAGGPLSFANMIKKHIPKISRGRWTVTSSEVEKVDAVILPAFLGYKEMLGIKVANPNCKVTSRVDGLPVDFSGNLVFERLELMKKIMDDADYIVWQSNHCREMWKEYVNTDRGTIIHNGVDLDVFRRTGDVYSFPGSVEHILCVNYSTFPHKRRDILDQIIAKNQAMKFHIVGHYIDAMDLDIEKAHWSQFHNVDYLGPILNNPGALASLFRGATCLLFTSEMEGSPNTVLEATACGCPIIYNAKANVVPEILGDVLAQGFTDPAEFEKLVYNIKDFATRRELAAKLEVVAEAYSAEVCVNKYLRVLDGKITMKPNQSR